MPKKRNAHSTLEEKKRINALYLDHIGLHTKYRLYVGITEVHLLFVFQEFSIYNFN